MRDTVTTSWRRLSDGARRHADSGSTRGARVAPEHLKEAQQLETWEDEGGHTELSVEPVRILIVDSDIGSSDSLELMLHASGYPQTRVAYSGHAALAIAAEFQPSVVLLELNLLDMSGFEVARLLREQAQSQDLRLIALMPSREPAGREQVCVAGFERCLVKPIAADELSGFVANAKETAMNPPAGLAPAYLTKKYPLFQRSAQP